MHVVLVHGAGGSSRTWSSVGPLLSSRGVPHTVVDNPSRSLTEDTARVEGIVRALDGDVLLVGHSYGGAVITNAGRTPGVRGLVYVAAWVPDQDESVQDIVRRYPPAEVSHHFTRGPAGEWTPVGGAAARQALAWDVPQEVWAAEADEPPRPSGDEIFSQVSGAPAWARLPSWYLLATADKHIRVEAQRDMAARAGSTVVEVDTSHAVPHVVPDRVAEVVAAAIAATTNPSTFPQPQDGAHHQ